MPAAAIEVHHRQPRLILRVESSGCDHAQFACGGAAAIGCINTKQRGNGRSGLRASPDTPPAQPFTEHRPDRSRPSRAYAFDAFQSSVMGGHLQLLERLDFQLVMEAG
ncbi:MAG: hypothetical protein AB7T58_07925, partial [Hyphomonadaceae bacterium]